MTATDAPNPPADVEETATRKPLYSDVEAWVVGYFAPMFLHRVPANPRVRWCARWWDHAEAITRLSVLWTTWEAARHDPAAKPGWWLDLDHHLPILLALDGPFRNCRRADAQRDGKHEPLVHADVDPAPAGWWR
jgi:hypothetical protein